MNKDQSYSQYNNVEQKYKGGRDLSSESVVVKKPSEQQSIKNHKSASEGSQGNIK